MIKAISLIFDPAITWDKIALAKKGLGYVFFWFLTPLVLISVGGEMAGVVYLGRRADNGSTISIPEPRMIAYCGAELAMSFLVVFIGARLVKSVSETFHGRHSYAKCFSVVAYTLGPLFLLRLLDAFPVMNPWASFGIGMVLSVTTLYYGVPRVLQPDPPDAFGVYLISVLLLAGVAALARFLTLLVLDGGIKFA